MNYKNALVPWPLRPTLRLITHKQQGAVCYGVECLYLVKCPLVLGKISLPKLTKPSLPIALLLRLMALTVFLKKNR